VTAALGLEAGKRSETGTQDLSRHVAPAVKGPWHSWGDPPSAKAPGHGCSWPCLPCVERLCSELAPFRNQIVFRFSIGSASNAVLKFWEPGAPTFKQRLACLKAAYLHDFQTSVSCEPMLDDNIDRVVDAVHPYVTDSIWLGKINRLRSILPQTCPNDADTLQRGEKLMAAQNDQATCALYARYKADPKIKWKDSIKKVVGIERPIASGMDE
jgi:hypothetical protein